MNNLLTIAIPTRNRFAYLKETIESLTEEEGFFEIEIIICDNSTDNNTYLGMKKYKTYENIFYAKNDRDLSIDENMIKTAGLVKSKYFLWLGDDDFIRKGFLKEILNIVQQNEYDFVLLNAENVSSDLKISLGSTIDICKDLKYTSARNFFMSHCFHMPFGTLIVNKKLFNKSLDKVDRLMNTSHAYSGIIFDYLADIEKIKNNVNILVVSARIILLRNIDKTWKNNSTEIMFNQIPKWFILQDSYYQREIIKILKSYLNSQFSLFNLLEHRCKYQLRMSNFYTNTKFASFFQKVKYLIVLLFPCLKRFK